MKRIITLSFLAVVALFTACKVEEIDHVVLDSYIEVAEKDLSHTFDYKKYTKEIKVKSKHRYQTEADSLLTYGWFGWTIYQTSNLLSITAAENLYFRDRIGAIRMFNSTESKKVMLSQGGATEYHPASMGSENVFVGPTVSYPYFASANVNGGTVTSPDTPKLAGDSLLLTSYSVEFDAPNSITFDFTMSGPGASRPNYLYLSPDVDPEKGMISRAVVSYTQFGESYNLVDTVILNPSSRQIVIPILTRIPSLNNLNVTLYTAPTTSGKHAVSLAEIYLTGAMRNPTRFFEPFTDATCMEVAPGTDAEKLKTGKGLVPSKFVYNMAYFALTSDYKEVRIKEYAAKEYIPEGDLYDLGVTVKEREQSLVFFAKNVGNKPAWIYIKSTTPNAFTAAFAIVDGPNKVLLPLSNGSVYLRYEKEIPDMTYDPITINFASGEVDE